MNKNSELFFNKNEIEKTKEKYPTPFHIYDEKGIIENVKSLYKNFSWVQGFKNYFAIKACPNPYILKILKDKVAALIVVHFQNLFLLKK